MPERKRQKFGKEGGQGRCGGKMGKKSDEGGVSQILRQASKLVENMKKGHT